MRIREGHEFLRICKEVVLEYLGALSLYPHGEAEVSTVEKQVIS
jgi:hypothetical protein